MNTMFFTVGKQFTAAEIETLLKEAGFREISLVHTYGYYSLVSGGKPWQQGWWWTAATLTADILDSPGFDRHMIVTEFAIKQPLCASSWREVSSSGVG